MAEPSVRIRISPEGEVTFEANGVKGTGCTELTKALIDHMGLEIASSSLKSDYYEKESETQINARQ